MFQSFVMAEFDYNSVLDDNPSYTEFVPAYATFGQRLGAALIDGILISIPIGILNTIFNIGTDSSFLSINYYQDLSITSSLVPSIIKWLYSAGMESSAQQATFGKQAMGLKVTNMNGNPITFLNATGRYFGKIISAMILFIGFLMVLWTPKKQALHDTMAGTLVVIK
jgi:uncharacterized RDD family membrane protein YckC